MKFFIDENLPPHLARGLHILEQGTGSSIEILSIPEVFGRGVKDEEWIPQVGQQGGTVITQDVNIFRKRQQRELFEQCGVGLFFLKPPSKRGYTYWEMVQLLVNRWPELKQLHRQNQRPYAFEFRHGGKFIKL
ncbi:hypothetical protein [Telluribacter sp. SYSU D00476]|uniref:PIN-like domain-containing protein n=1 Tax=Telluribacter sp. SYSU D00476 TaxID=2811430 RepID=UPI001FF2B9FD|nr:hypothetical protein [Telluribacter sp. SYSU D00476]